MAHRQEEEKLLQMLSEPLKNEIAAETNVRVLMDLRVLSTSFSKGLLSVVSKALREMALSPEDVIFKVLSNVADRINRLMIG